MTGSQSPAFSFYAKDFLAGALSLSLAARGAYITLLAYQWDSGAIPGEASARQRILGCTRREADVLWAAIVGKFERGADGAWRNGRLEGERRKQATRSAALAENGKKGAESRWQKDGKPIANAIASAIAEPIADASQTDDELIADEWQNDGLSSSSSYVHTPRARNAPLIVPGAHRNHAKCGVVCLPAAAYESFAKKLGGNYAKLDAWADGVLADWQRRVAAGGAVPDGDDFAFWRHRWAESFGSTKAPRGDPGTRPAGMCLNRHTPPCANDIECSSRRRREMDHPAEAS